MKKLLNYLLILFLFPLLFINGCQSDFPAPDVATTSTNQGKEYPNPDLFIAQLGDSQMNSRGAIDGDRAINGRVTTKVKICHLTAKGEFILLEVNQNALAAHLAHGDIAQAYYHQGFENDISGWFDATSEPAWYGEVTMVSSGTNGISSSVGDWHALFKGDASSAPFSRFDGYVDTWSGTWAAEIDVYLDPTWNASQGFDYAVAATGSDGSHQRDFIFHVNKDASTGKVLVAGSNNTNFAPREDLENLNHYEVTTAGWYTLQHVFYENGSGALAVDLNLLDSNGNILFTETRSNPSDVIATEIGGNRYGWFTFINVDGGVRVDEQEIYRNCALQLLK